jgi:signal transduction histidine kinase
MSPTERLLDEIERSRDAALLAELASGVAHQIRNPLSNLLYALHLLKQEGINEGEKRELIDSATERVENINRTITQFIQYTRIPKLHLSLESINDVVANTVRSFNGWMDLKAINLEMSLDQLLPSTRIDIFLINQAFHDIIKNALEATQDCGDLRVSTRKLNLRHGPEPRLEFAEIIFEDNGPGIEPEDLEKVLKPFYSKKESGLGLGLALVDHVIRAHGGAVTLTNRQEGGTRVKIYLPIR